MEVVLYYADLQENTSHGYATGIIGQTANPTRMESELSASAFHRGIEMIMETVRHLTIALCLEASP